jgi:hypothetical protein
MKRVSWITRAFVLLTACYGTAHAGLIGATVDVGAYDPTSSSLFKDGGITTVSGAIEYPSGSFAGYNSSWQIDITDTQLILTDAAPSNGFPFASAAFNGFILTVLSGPTLVSASVDPSSAFSPVISIVGGNELLLNYQGVTGSGAVSSIIDITTGASSVPEPATWLTVLTSGMGLLGARWLKARQKL